MSTFARIGVECGQRWWSWRSWRRGRLLRTFGGRYLIGPELWEYRGFAIGPIMVTYRDRPA